MFDEEKIPNKWVWTTVNEIAKSIQYGYTESSTDKPIGPKFLRITDIQDEQVNWDDVPYCKIKKEDRSRYLLQKGDFVFARTGATVGKSFLIKGDIPESIYASYLIRLRFFNEILDQYIGYYFRSPYYWKQITKKQVGTGQPNVNGTLLGLIVLPLPPLPEQHRIVAKIEELFSELDRGVQALQTAKAQLKTYRQAVLKHAFEGKLTEEWRKKNGHDVGNRNNEIVGDDSVGNGHARSLRNILPEGWDSVSIDQFLVNNKKGMATGPFGTALKKSEHQTSGVPVLGIENIGEGIFQMPNKIFVSISKAKELKAFTVIENDIIISRSGTVGEICAVPAKMENSLISTNIIRVRLNCNVILPKYFVYMFQGGDVRKQVFDLCKGSSRAFLNQTILKTLSFPYCPLPEQSAIVAEIESRLSVCDKLEATIEQSLAQAESLRQSILKKAFEGKLVAQDPGDEPASVLLERIRKEREIESEKSHAAPARSGASVRNRHACSVRGISVHDTSAPKKIKESK
jgi:type I restriction enzyme S subunit